MKKYKKHPKYHVVSMRVSDEEKSALEEMMRQCNKSVSRLMRAAIQLYVPQLEARNVPR